MRRRRALWSRNDKAVLKLTSSRRKQGTSIPERPEMESRSGGVLDTRLPGCVRSRGFFALTVTVVAATSSPFSHRGGLERLQKGGHSENVDDPFEIIVQHSQGQFGFGFFQSLDQEFGLGHQPFHRPKRMFDRFPPVLHPDRIGARPSMHGFPRILVKIAHDDPPRRLGTLRLQRAGAARPPRVLFLLLGMGSLEQAQRGASRTAPAVVFVIVAEPVTAEVLDPV